MRAAVTIESLPQGDAGTWRTLDVMAQAVRGELAPDYNGWQSEPIREWVVKAANGMLAGFDSETGALFEFVRDAVRYRRDPVGTERVQDALQTLRLNSGDCDDKVVLLATGLAALGWTPRFVVQRQTGGDFDHVYLEAFDDKRGEWVAFDPTGDGQDGRPLAQPGWRNRAVDETRYEIFSEATGMAGITGLGDFFSDPYGIDWQRIIERGIDVAGARYGNSNPYISPDDPRYRANVNIGYPQGGYYPRGQAGENLAVSSQGVQLSTPLLLALAMGGGLLLAGVLFGKGRR